MLKYYVYAYLRNKDSKTAKAGTPYYIGKGTGKRAYEKHRVPKPKDRSLIVILENNLTNVGACALERRLIQWWGRIDLGTGILRNQTEGGDGVEGRIFSLESRQKISTSRIGMKFSDSHCANLSKPKNNTKGPKLTLEQVEQIREDLSSKQLTRRDICNKLNISYETVKSIELGRLWNRTKTKDIRL